MKRKSIVLMAVAAPVLISCLTSCKGRTMENMEPTGDTVEVVIEQPVDDTGATEAQL